MLWLKKIKSLIRWQKAIDLIVAENYEAAEEMLTRVDAQRVPYIKNEYHCVYAFILTVRQKQEEAAEKIRFAMTYTKLSNNLASNEKLYRLLYLRTLWSLNSGIDEEICDLEYRSVDLRKISSRTKYYLPLKRHPDWNRSDTPS